MEVTVRYGTTTTLTGLTTLTGDGQDGRGGHGGFWGARLIGISRRRVGAWACLNGLG